MEICAGTTKNLLRRDCNKGAGGVVPMACGIGEFLPYTPNTIFIDLNETKNYNLVRGRGGNVIPCLMFSWCLSIPSLLTPSVRKGMTYLINASGKRNEFAWLSLFWVFSFGSSWQQRGREHSKLFSTLWETHSAKLPWSKCVTSWMVKSGVMC